MSALVWSSYDLDRRRGSGGCAGDFGGETNRSMCDETAEYALLDGWCETCGVGVHACAHPFVHASTHVVVPLCARHVAEVRADPWANDAVLRVQDATPPARRADADGAEEVGG